MNLSVPLVRLLATLLALMAFLVADAHAQTNTSRHLLLIDTSFAAGRRKAETLALVRRVVESGFGSSISDGQKYSVWTFNERAYPRNFPDQVWSAQDAGLQAELIGRFLATQKHTEKANVRNAIRDAHTFIDQPGETRVFLIAGSAAIFQGPSLIQLERFEDYYRAHLQQAKKAAIATLIARDSSLVLWAVDHNSGPFQVPAIPPVGALTNATVGSSVSTNAPTLLQPPVVKVEDRLATTLRIVPQTNQLPKQTSGRIDPAPAQTEPEPPRNPPEPAAAQGKEPEEKPARTSLIESRPASAPLPESTPTAAPPDRIVATPALETSPVEHSPEPQSIKETPAPDEQSLEVSSPPEAPAPATVLSPEAPTQPPLARTSAPASAAIAVLPVEPRGSSVRLWLALTGGLLVFASVLIIWNRRRKPAPKPSLISQSFRANDH
ncbi:MAG TPA: hypothetical protein VEH27_18635 [Methylomirabilota bacterium]|nr:hypothetical protein [Methylomirabilota bacterium]